MLGLKVCTVDIAFNINERYIGLYAMGHKGRSFHENGVNGMDNLLVVLLILLILPILFLEIPLHEDIIDFIGADIPVDGRFNHFYGALPFLLLVSLSLEERVHVPSDKFDTFNLFIFNDLTISTQVFLQIFPPFNDFVAD